MSRTMTTALAAALTLHVKGAWAQAPAGDAATDAPATTSAPAPAPAPATRPAQVSPELWDKLQRIDAAAAQIHDMQAQFDKLKHTPLLKRPLVVHGTVKVCGDTARWDTLDPYPGTTLIAGGTIQLYQPQEKRLEVYDLGDRLDLFGASPVPSFAKMLIHFTVEERTPGETFTDLPAGQYLALRWTPREAQTKEHLDHLDMLFDEQAGVLLRLRMTPPQGASWTEYRFSDWRMNTGLDVKELELHLPADVQVVHPLAGMPATP